MKNEWKRAVASFLALALVAVLCLSCDGGGKGVTIVIGELTDFTGPAGPACKPIHYAIQDMARYYSEDALIPG